MTKTTTVYPDKNTDTIFGCIAETGERRILVFKIQH